MSQFDFAPEHRNAQAFLSEKYARELFDDNCWSPVNMDVPEVCKSIVADVLAVTVWELQTQDKLHFDFQELTRFVDEYSKHEIKALMTDPRVYQHVVTKDGQYRIKTDKASLKAAMEYCGIYYFGETPEMKTRP